MLRIIENEDKEIVKSIRERLKETNGFCPCSIIQDDAHRCVCQEFREQNVEGLCHCGLYKKIKVEK